MIGLNVLHCDFQLSSFRFTTPTEEADVLAALRLPLAIRAGGPAVHYEHRHCRHVEDEGDDRRDD